MRLFLGTVIVIVSMGTMAFNFWFYYYHMIAFGRGLLEALPSERTIAFVFTSLPFIVSVYLALRHLIFDNNRAKRQSVKKKWTSLDIAGAFACLAIFWFPISHFSISLYYTLTQEGPASACDRMESDAQSTAAAIADYFADPNHIALPTVDQLIETEGLSTNCPIAIKEGTNGDPIITVIDDTAKCRKGKKYVFYMNGTASEWKD